MPVLNEIKMEKCGTIQPLNSGHHNINKVKPLKTTLDPSLLTQEFLVFNMEHATF